MFYITLIYATVENTLEDLHFTGIAISAKLLNSFGPDNRVIPMCTTREIIVPTVSKYKFEVVVSHM